jgi:nuclear GTP-binding protein
VNTEPKSKRVSVRLRHRIEKASSAKQRKARKESKKNPEWRSRLKKDPGIPNLFPYKDKLLAEIEQSKIRKQEEIARKRAEVKAAKGAKTGEEDDDVEDAVEGFEDDEEEFDMEMDEDDEDANPMAALLASARARAQEYEGESGSDDYDDEDSESNVDMDDNNILPNKKDSSRKAFDKVFKQVVDAADVVLYVLDARDPEGTRSKEVERMVMAAASGGKRLILILNKVDLIPAPVLKNWLIHLRRYFPTIPLRASGPAPNAHTFNHKNLTPQSTAQTLFKALKSFAAAKQLKRAVSVGVIGYPNVGKSSVINALTSRMGGGQACPTGSEAGVTTSIREVKIDSKLKLLDSPGIVFPSSHDGTKTSKVEERARLVLLNAVPPKQIEDPVPAVTLLLKRLSKHEGMISKLMDVYGLPPLKAAPNGDPTNDFLIQVARKRGRLGKGGIPNINSAATTVITDWRDGRIQGWMDAPVLAVAPSVAPGAAAPGAVVGDQKEIVTEWAKEFKLEGLWGNGETDEDATMEE